MGARKPCVARKLRTLNMHPPSDVASLGSEAMGTVYAIANQKGGVGKTTTAVNLAACVDEAGYETLLIDIDAQSNATLGLGIDKRTTPTVYDSLIADLPLAEAVRPTSIEHLSLVPAGPDLAGASVELPRI